MSPIRRRPPATPASRAARFACKTSLLLAAAALLAQACAASETSDLDTPDAGRTSIDAGPAADAGTTADAGPPDKDLFDPGHVLRVEIQLPEADWDQLRMQTRDIDTLLRDADCLAAPFASPFTYFSGRVSVDGEVIEQAGVRKKGFIGSLSEDKPSLKIKFSEYVHGQRLHGRRMMTLNNARQDPSLLHQCAAYSVFESAGVPAPRCNFATVAVNGRPLGVYVQVEAVDEDFLRDRFGDDSGKLYEGTLSDFRPDWVTTFETKSSTAAGDDRTELSALVAAAAADDASLTASLSPLIDLDAFTTFWAAEVLVAHWDGYTGNTNNFYLYLDPRSHHFRFIPWGADGALMPRPNAPAAPKSVMATGILARRLYLLAATRASYVARLQALLADHFNETTILDAIDRNEALILPAAPPGERVTISAAISELRAFVRNRRTEITRELGTPPPWTEPLRASPCYHPVGTLQATFDTRWGTLAEQNVFMTGTGTIDATLGGVALPVRQTGSKSGLDSSNPADPRAAIQVIGLAPDNTALVVVISLPPQALRPLAGAPAGLFTGIFAALARYNLSTMQSELLGIVNRGTLRLEAASDAPDAPVRGSVEGELVELMTGG